MSKFGNFLSFIKLLHIEPYIFLFSFGFSIKHVTLNLLMQVYNMLIANIPAVFWSLFMGAWSDAWIHGRKALLLLGAAISVLENGLLMANALLFPIDVNWMMVSFVPSAMLGGMLATYTAAWSHATQYTPVGLRSIRFTVLEVFNFFGRPISSVIGGKVLTYLTPLGGNGQLHNYSTVFLIGSISGALAFLWALFLINEKENPPPAKIDATGDDTNENIRVVNYGATLNDNSINQTLNNAEIQQADSQTPLNSTSHQKNPFKMLFDFDRVREMWRTCTMQRPGDFRLQIWLIFLSVVVIMMTHMAPMYITFQFTQKAYRWTADTYSTLNAIASSAVQIVTMLSIPVLVKCFRLRDVTLTILGILSYYGQYIILGAWLTPLGFWISVVVGVLGNMSSIGVRSYLTTIVDKSETGRVFSFMSAVDSIAPMLASTIFTMIFRETIDSYLGLAFHVIAALQLLPLLVMIWIHSHV